METYRMGFLVLVLAMPLYLRLACQYFVHIQKRPSRALADNQHFCLGDKWIYIIISQFHRPSGDSFAGSSVRRFACFEKCLDWRFRRVMLGATVTKHGPSFLPAKISSLVRIWLMALYFLFFFLVFLDSIDTTYNWLLQPPGHRLVSWTIMHWVCIHIR